MGAATSARTDLLKQLRELGVETVTADYDGSGDSGQIEDPQFGSVEVPRALMTSVQDLFYEFLQELYDGWEIDEGSFGEFTWIVQEDTISLAHTTRFEATKTEERQL